MPSKLKICVCTGARSEYGLLLPLLKAMKADKSVNLQLLVTGMHLSPEFGMTVREIEKDGFHINGKIEALLSSDTDSGVAKSTGIAMMGFADAFKGSAPDAVVLLGDRFETFAIASAAYLMKIPVMHIHGGETTEGATDEGLRHAITKMSYLHFTSTEKYRQRVIQLGEDPGRVFNVGAIGLDNIRDLRLMDRKALEKEIGFSLKNRTALVTFHPVTLEQATASAQCIELMAALDAEKDFQVIFTYPNADADGRVIIEQINAFVEQHPSRARAFPSLGVMRYLSCLKHASVVIGNSSSAIIEAPSFRIPVVNIGDRQKGRVQADNVINAAPLRAEIAKAMKKAFSPAFLERCAKLENPYGDGRTASRIMKVLKSKLKNIELKKKFYDLSV